MDRKASIYILAPALPDGFGPLRVSGSDGPPADPELKKAEISAVRRPCDPLRPCRRPSEPTLGDGERKTGPAALASWESLSPLTLRSGSPRRPFSADAPFRLSQAIPSETLARPRQDRRPSPADELMTWLLSGRTGKLQFISSLRLIRTASGRFGSPGQTDRLLILNRRKRRSARSADPPTLRDPVADRLSLRSGRRKTGRQTRPLRRAQG